MPHEGNGLLAEKIDLTLKYGLKPIYCFGETQVERKSGEFVKVISRQISESLFHLSQEAFSKLVLAYEPVWAIGTGETATPEQANEIHAMVREQIKQKYMISIQRSVFAYYMVDQLNQITHKSYFNNPDIDGGLIGGAALDARSFVEIIKQA